jgi:hypothetical protein
VPLVVNTQHGLYAQPSDRWQRRWPVYAAERVAAAFGHVELVQNEEDVHTLVHTLKVPARKVRLLGNGIDLQRFRSGAVDASARARLRTEWGVGEHEVVCGTVGLYERSLMLTPDEVSTWEQAGPAGLEPLVEAIRNDVTDTVFGHRYL